MRRASLVLAGLPFALAIAGACVPGAGPALNPPDAEAPPPVNFGEAGSFRLDAGLGEKFAIGGVTPSHGPFTGGTRSRLDGRGFSSRLRVFIGNQEVDGSAILASDPTRAAIVTPPGDPGFVDVKIRDDAAGLERTLANGYYYDPLVITPENGATSGGTRITVTGSGTKFATGTTVTIGGVECTDVRVTDATKLECVTPSSTPGSKDIVVSVQGADPIQVRDAFTYADSVDGYRGGLSGGALSGRVKVLAFDQITGLPIAGAYAIAGSNLSTAKQARTALNGVVEIADVPGDKVTVTVAAKCHSPITYVDVPVDTVTVYLPFVFSAECIKGDPQSLPSGTPKVGGFVNGEVVFPGGTEEFERANWTTVPQPTKPTERRAAYVFEAATSPNGTFQLPPASAAITPDTDGTGGFKYSLLVFPGNATLYVIAGLEDRSEEPPKFVPYSMGIVRGLSVPASGRVDSVDVKMDILFDHEVKLSANPPPPGPRGPDRFSASLAVTLGASGFAIIPRGTRVTPLPTPGEISFVGVPALDRALTNEQYVIGGVAGTGAGLAIPASVVSRVRTTDANGPVSLGGFLNVPTLAQPGAGIWSGTSVSLSNVSPATNLTELTIISGGGLVSWTIVAPGDRTSFELPDLSKIPSADPVALRRGAIITTVYTARIDQFTYGRIRSGQLAASAWNAYAVDTLTGVY